MSIPESDHTRFVHYEKRNTSSGEKYWVAILSNKNLSKIEKSRDSVYSWIELDNRIKNLNNQGYPSELSEKVLANWPTEEA